MQFDKNKLAEWFVYCRGLTVRVMAVGVLHIGLRGKLRAVYIEGIKYHLSQINELERSVAALIGSFAHGCVTPDGSFYSDVLWGFKPYCCAYCETGFWCCIGRCEGYWECTKDCIAREWCLSPYGEPFVLHVQKCLQERNLDVSWLQEV